MIKKEIVKCGEWCKDYGIDIIHTTRYEEVYGDVRLRNKKFSFLAEKSGNVVHYDGRYVDKILEYIEKLHVLNCYGFLDDYGEYILSRFYTPEGYRWQEVLDWRYVFEKSIIQKIDEAMLELSKSIIFKKSEEVPVLQIRANWEITSGGMCHRCYQPWEFDSLTYCYARFTFGLINRKYLNSYRSILFRKF